jgi:hypothetical protein
VNKRPKGKMFDPGYQECRFDIGQKAAGLQRQALANPTID